MKGIFQFCFFSSKYVYQDCIATVNNYQYHFHDFRVKTRANCWKELTVLIF